MGFGSLQEEKESPERGGILQGIWKPRSWWLLPGHSQFGPLAVPGIEPNLQSCTQSSEAVRHLPLARLPPATSASGSEASGHQEPQPCREHSLYQPAPPAAGPVHRQTSSELSLNIIMNKTVKHFTVINVLKEENVSLCQPNRTISTITSSANGYI